jgi:hypothetical protein
VAISSSAPKNAGEDTALQQKAVTMICNPH